MRKIGIACLISILLLSGCSRAYSGEGKKIVLEEDVRTHIEKENMEQIKGEEVSIFLEEGEFFYPSFYLEDQIYGWVTRGIGLVDEKYRKEYPIDAMTKKYLYALDENNELEQTSKQVFTGDLTSRVIGKDRRQRELGEKGKILSVDYLVEDTPKVVEDLSSQLEDLGINDQLWIEEYLTTENETILTIRTTVPYKGTQLYFYDRQTNQLYERKEQVFDEDRITYIPALEKFIYTDNNYQVYQVKFEEKSYTFEKYLDLGQYIKEQSEEAINLQVIPINEEKVLILEGGFFRTGEYFDYHPIYQTRRVSQFNFVTNEYEELLKAEEGENFYVNYVGERKITEEVLLLVDYFGKEEGYISPLYRELKKIENNQLITLFKEDIREEGLTLSPSVHVRMNEEGNEIFVTKEVTTMKNDVETTQEAIYKRYTFN